MRCVVVVLVLGLLHPASVVDCESNLPSSANCRNRELTINADSRFSFFVDGNRVDLKNAQNSTQSDTVLMTGDSRLLAVQVESSQILSGMIASSDRDDILSDDSWKCTNDFHPDWMALGFNDNDWPHAQVLCPNGFAHWGYIDGISDNASWITAPDSLVCRDGDVPSVTYCRKTLGQENIISSCYCLIFTYVI